MAPQNKWFAASPNTDYIYRALTDGTVTNLTGGRIPKMNAAQAAGLVGSWLIETGRKDLSNLDVVETGSGRGRGLSQYTGVRRTPYDQAVQQARAAGKDPNSAQWQIEYFAKEYMNKDLIGWTRVFEKMPQNLKNAGDYARYFTGSAAEGKGYFRPGVPHNDRRMQAAMEVYNHYSKGQGAPKPQAQSQDQPQGNPKGQNNWLQDTLNKLGIKGGSQSFNMNKLQRNLGSIAANTPVSDVGFAVFASQKGIGNANKAWKKLDNNTKRAYGRAGGQLAINSNPGYYAANQTGGSQQTYKMPKNLSIGSGSRNYSKDSKIDFSRNKTQSGGTRSVGGLPGLNDISQAGIANYGHFKKKSAGYGAAAYGMSNSTVGRINSQSYGSSMNMGRSLGINTSATSAAGARYGGAAMSSSWNAGATAATGYGYSK